MEEWDVDQGPINEILVAIQITLRIQNFFKEYT